MTPTQAAESFARALRLERLARGDDALQTLETCEQWPFPYNEQAMVLRATILANRDPIAALDSLPEDVEAFSSVDGRFGYFSTAGRAYIKARNLPASERLLDAARRELRGEEDPHRYDLAMWAAWLQWNRREYDPANPDLLLAAQAPDPELYMRALNLRAWMHGGLEDHGSLLHGLLDCIRFYQANAEQCSLRLLAYSLQSAADIAWEMHDVEAASLSSGMFDAIPWTRELQAERYSTARALAWHAFLNGDTAAAKARFSQAAQLAFTQAWSVMAAVDAAHIAWLAGDAARTQAELRAAREIADTVDWAATRLERMALIALAALLARYDAPAAIHYTTLYHRLRPQSLLERMDDTHEPRRLQAYQKYADAQIAAVGGNRGLAVRLFSDAHDIFAHIGFVFRAALASNALFELTGEERWLRAARTHAMKFSKGLPNLHALCLEFGP